MSTADRLFQAAVYFTACTSLLQIAKKYWRGGGVATIYLINNICTRSYTQTRENATSLYTSARANG